MHDMARKTRSNTQAKGHAHANAQKTPIRPFKLVCTDLHPGVHCQEAVFVNKEAESRRHLGHTEVVCAKIWEERCSKNKRNIHMVAHGHTHLHGLSTENPCPVTLAPFRPGRHFC